MWVCVRCAVRIIPDPVHDPLKSVFSVDATSRSVPCFSSLSQLSNHVRRPVLLWLRRSPKNEWLIIEFFPLSGGEPSAGECFGFLPPFSLAESKSSAYDRPAESL